MTDQPNTLFEYHVGVVDDVFINSGLSPLNSIVIARQRLADEGLSNQAIGRVLLASFYADVEELNLRGVIELL